MCNSALTGGERRMFGGFILCDFCNSVAVPETRVCLAHYLRIQFEIDCYKKALSICNRLKPSPTKARHVSRIFSRLNKLRAAV
jgi:hypothetical protein